MKKWFILALIVCFGAAVQAGEEGKKKGEDKGKGKDVTKEAFVANQKKMAEKKGTEFDQAKSEARFEKLDKNKDGKLSADEKPAKKKKQKKPAAPAAE